MVREKLSQRSGEKSGNFILSENCTSLRDVMEK